MSKLRNMLFPGETHEIFTFTPQYRVVPNQSMAGPEKRISQDDGRGLHARVPCCAKCMQVSQGENCKESDRSI